MEKDDCYISVFSRFDRRRRRCGGAVSVRGRFDGRMTSRGVCDCYALHALANIRRRRQLICVAKRRERSREILPPNRGTLTIGARRQPSLMFRFSFARSSKTETTRARFSYFNFIVDKVCNFYTNHLICVYKLLAGCRRNLVRMCQRIRCYIERKSLLHFLEVELQTSGRLPKCLT